MPKPSSTTRFARLSDLLEGYLSHGTARAASADVLLIRRARGFALIGLVSLFLGGVVLSGLAEVAVVSAGMMVVLVGTVALGFVDNGRFIRPITHGGMAAMLAGIVGVGMHIGYVNPISSIFPILLVVSATHVLGVRPAFFWMLASIGGMGWTTLALEIPAVPDGAIPISKLGSFLTGAVAMIGVFALAATERHFSDERRKELDFLARHDPLTGLLNRRALEGHMLDTWSRCKRYGRRFAVLVMDLDGFKLVNDEHGHGVGDAILSDLANRIAEMTRDTDRACRVGGDEFVLVLEDVGDDKNIALVAHRILAELSAPVRLGNIDVGVGVSIGLAVYPNGASGPTELMKAADLAMYAVKSAGGRGVCFDGAPDLSSVGSSRGGNGSLHAPDPLQQ
jgi:diguanylate cyclase (GGDEF)-like protein